MLVSFDRVICSVPNLIKKNCPNVDDYQMDKTNTSIIQIHISHTSN